MTNYRPEITAFLIDIWRLEIGVSCRKHTMAVRSNRHVCGTLARAQGEPQNEEKSATADANRAHGNVKCKGCWP
jgi:hypothetical protein